MASVRAFAPVLALVVALVGAPLAPAAMAQASKPCPAASAHVCCKTPSLSPCCVRDSGHSSNGGPVEARVQLHPDLTAAQTAVAVMATADLVVTARVHTAPLRAGPADFPILFAALLI